MSKPAFQIFTAQDARNIVIEESKITLGKIIDIIREGAKHGHEVMNIDGAPIEDGVLDTLKQRGFDVTETTISWSVTPLEVVTDDSEDIDNEPSAEVEEEE